MYRCCIFDLDGTLVNSIHAITYTTNLTLEKFGVGPIDETHAKVFVGDGYKKLVERALVYCGDNSREHYEGALVEYQRLFRIHCLYQVEAYDGIKELLEFMKHKELKIAVVSNKPHERTIENVEAVFGKGYFDKITGEQEGIKCKPDPSGVLMTAEKLGATPVECLYFGDTNTDMKTGIAAGMDTVGVTWGFRDREELEAFHPKYLIGHPSEIISALE